MALDLVSIGLACADVGVRPVDTFPEVGKLTLVPLLELHLGGLAGVTATVFSQLGGRAAFIGKVGEDGFGEYLVSAMEGEGVDVSRVLRSNDKGSAATVVLINAAGERTFLHHAGANTGLTEQDIDFDFVCGARHVHWGGPAVTAGLDGEPIGRILKKVREAGLTTSMDTCYDGEGKWFSRIEHALPHLTIAMSSLEEARMYTGKQDPEAIADFYLSHGPKIAMIKLGPEGLLVKSEGETHRIPAHQVVAVDTTGAGDAACAGFLYGYLNGWNLLESARLANAVGGLTVQRMGGAEAISCLGDALDLMED